MGDEVEEHKALHDGFMTFKTCIDQYSKDVSKFNGAELVKLLDDFAPALEAHLAHEPTKLAEMSHYPIDIKAISDKTAQYSMKKTSTTKVLPMLWYNLDKDFEDGRWASFPEMPSPVKWVMVNVFGWWRSNWWRFGSSGPDGVQRDLYCVKPGY